MEENKDGAWAGLYGLNQRDECSFPAHWCTVDDSLTHSELQTVETLRTACLKENIPVASTFELIQYVIVSKVTLPCLLEWLVRMGGWVGRTLHVLGATADEGVRATITLIFIFVLFFCCLLVCGSAMSTKLWLGYAK